MCKCICTSAGRRLAFDTSCLFNSLQSSPPAALRVCVCIQFLFNNFHLTAIYRVVTRTRKVGEMRLPVCRSQSPNSTWQLFLSPTVCLSVCLAIRLCNPRRSHSTHVALGGCDIEIYYRQSQVVREEVATRGGVASSVLRGGSS